MATTATQAMAGPSRQIHNDAPTRPWLEDQTTPLFVGVAVTACSIVGAGLGATLGMVGHDNPFRTSATMGGRWFAASSVFFGCREYLVTPLMTHYELTATHSKMNRQLSLKQLGKLPQPPAPELAYTRWETRTQRVVDSGVSGGIVAGGAMWIVGGRSRAFKGGLTGLIAASLLQFTANSLRMAKRDLFDPPPSPTTPARVDFALQTSLPPDQPSAPPNTQLDAVIESRWDRFTSRSVQAFKRWFPIKHHSTEELLERWTDRRAALEGRLRDIEAQELRLYEKVQALQLEQQLHGRKV